MHEVSHLELINAMSLIEELEECLPSLSSKKIMTGRLLCRCNSGTDLMPYGFNDELIASIFYDDYLSTWKIDGVPVEMIAPVR